MNRFRLNGVRYLITYKSWLDKIDLYNFFVDKCVNEKKFECFIAHETGLNDESTPYEHSHVYVNFGGALSNLKGVTRAQDWFDYNDIHPHIQPIRQGSSNEKRVKMYICKEDLDPELQDLKKNYFWKKLIYLRASRNARHCLKQSENMVTLKVETGLI